MRFNRDERRDTVYALEHYGLERMAISEERVQLLLPRQLKEDLQRRAKRLGVSISEYVRRLIEMDLRENDEERKVDFPFGKNPIRGGRTRGSVEHDRPE